MPSVINKYRRYNWVDVTFVVVLHMTDNSLSNHSSQKLYRFVPSSNILGRHHYMGHDMPTFDILHASFFTTP